MYLLGGFFSLGFSSSITVCCLEDLLFIEPVLYLDDLSMDWFPEFCLFIPRRLVGDVWNLELLSPVVISVLLDKLEGTCIPTFFFNSYYLGFKMLYPGSITSNMS